MSNRAVRLTSELIKDVANFIRAGGYPEVAAEALGIPVDVFHTWMHEGNGRRRNDRRRMLGESVRKAAAQARLKAEVELFANDPAKWLLHGPGKETPTRPGWSLMPHASCQLGTGLSSPDASQSWQFVQELYAVLQKHPAAHAEVLELCRSRGVPIDE
jgi:hypothetical protein